jgi:hypothetical protein
MLGICCIFPFNFRVGVGEEEVSFIGPKRGSSTDMEHFFHLGKVQKRSGWLAKYFVTNNVWTIPISEPQIIGICYSV